MPRNFRLFMSYKNIGTLNKPLISIIAGSTSDKEVYEKDYKWAVKFLKKHKRTIIKKSSDYKTDTATIVSVVFPEIIRYSIFKDYFEIKGLELIYVEHGKKYADFSIGYFQMKPSFFEKIEEYVNRSNELKAKFPHIIEYQNIIEKRVRKERLERFKNFDWQLE